jgi:hypothetical protein
VLPKKKKIKIRRIVAQRKTRQIVGKTTLKISNMATQNRTGGVAQVAEQLLSKHEALSSYSNIPKKKKKCRMNMTHVEDVNDQIMLYTAMC